MPYEQDLKGDKNEKLFWLVFIEIRIIYFFFLQKWMFCFHHQKLICGEAFSSCSLSGTSSLSAFPSRDLCVFDSPVLLENQTTSVLISRKKLSFPASWAFFVAGHPVLQSSVSPSLLSLSQPLILVS